MALKRKRTSSILKEWMECGIITYGKNQVHNPIPAKFLIVAYDPESREDYPMYAEKLVDVNDVKSDLVKRGQKVVEVINL